MRLDELPEANQPLLTVQLMRNDLKRLWFQRHAGAAQQAWKH